MVALCDEGVTTTDVRKSADLLSKAGLVEAHGKKQEGETLWCAMAVDEGKLLRDMDRAMLVRLIVGLEESSMSLAIPHAQPLLLGRYGTSEIKTLLSEVQKARRAAKTEDASGAAGEPDNCAPRRRED